MATLFGYSHIPVTSGTASNTAANITVTPPSSMVAGQLVRVVVTMDGVVTTAAIAVDGGQSWNTGANQAGTQVSSQVYWCIFDGTWDANPQWSFTGGTTSIGGIITMQVFDPEADTTFEADVAEAVSTFNASNPTVDVTRAGITVADDALIFADWVCADDITWSGITNDFAYTNSESQITSTSGNDCGISQAWKYQTAGGASGNVTNTVALTGQVGHTRIQSFKEVSSVEADHVVFGDQPQTTTVDVTMPEITVEARDSLNVLDTGFVGTATIAIEDDPSLGSAVLSGTLEVDFIDGVATWDDLAIDTEGEDFTFSVTTDPALTGAESNAFDIIAQVATYLEFVVQPSNVVEGVAIAPSITVEANKPDTTRDTAWENNITLAIGSNPGGGVIGGTTTRAAVAGLATFNDIEISAPGTAYTLLATAGGLTEDESATFNVTLEPADHLYFHTGPSNTQVDAVITPAVVIRCRNSENIVDTNYTGEVTIAVETGAGTLGGDTVKNAVAGVVTFDDLTLDTVETGVVLRVTAAGLTLADSAAFDITAGTPPSARRGFGIRMGSPLSMRL